MKIIERKVYPIEIMNVGNRFLLQTSFDLKTDCENVLFRIKIVVFTLIGQAICIILI